jgi:hypothetical protein
VPQLGHIPQLFRAMSSKDDAVPASAVLIVLALADSAVRLGHSSGLASYVSSQLLQIVHSEVKDHPASSVLIVLALVDSAVRP